MFLIFLYLLYTHTVVQRNKDTSVLIVLSPKIKQFLFFVLFCRSQPFYDLKASP